jgi:hypothetical protein
LTLDDKNILINAVNNIDFSSIPHINVISKSLSDKSTDLKDENSLTNPKHKITRLKH